MRLKAQYTSHTIIKYTPNLESQCFYSQFKPVIWYRLLGRLTPYLNVMMTKSTCHNHDVINMWCVTYSVPWMEPWLLQECPKLILLFLKFALLLLPLLLSTGADECLKAHLPFFCVQQHVVGIKDKLRELLLPGREGWYLRECNMWEWVNTHTHTQIAVAKTEAVS